MKKFFATGLTILMLFSITGIVYAQSGSGSTDVSDTILDNLDLAGRAGGLSDDQLDADARDVVVGIINATLTLFGIAFTILIIYGGWLWMTAAGNQDNVDKAKKTLQWAAIGIAIVVSSWAIGLFVANSLIEASGGSVVGT